MSTLHSGVPIAGGRDDPLYRHGALGLSILGLAALVGFWPSYLNAPKVDPLPVVHIHGIAMFAWVGLLAAQAWLIRLGRRPLHRAIGRLSYVLVPVIVLSTLALENARLRQRIDAEALYFLWIVLSLTAVFAFSYAMAMRNRRNPAIHARFMVCTALALVDPIFARILFFSLGVTPPMMQAATFVLVDAVLVALIYMDWKRGNRVRVFQAMLPLFLLTQVPTFLISQASWWKPFAQWYAALPLS